MNWVYVLSCGMVIGFGLVMQHLVRDARDECANCQTYPSQ